MFTSPLRALTLAGAVLAAAAGCAHTHASGLATSKPAPAPFASVQARRTAIRHARVWAATDIPSMDLMAGPAGPGAFAPNATITCDYIEKKMTGGSPKFTCVLPPDDEVKVKYGPGNGEVFGEVATTRLFWALGFGADRLYPVRVVCRGCPATIHGTEFATIQRKMAGRLIESASGSGWAWSELEVVDGTGTQRAERDALKLLAAMLQHTDSKAQQQRLICVTEPETPDDGAPCAAAFMMVHDVGLTFGHANLLNRNSVGSVNLEKWARTPVWKDPERCVANLSKSLTGTLNNPTISEAGRRFLAGLLVQLTDAQLHDLFDVARVTSRSIPAKHPTAPTTIAQWVDAFKQKRDAIVQHTCPDRP